MNTLTVYTGSFCQPCKLLKATLKNLDIRFDIKDVDEDADHFEAIGIRGVPTIVITDSSGNELYRVVGNKSAAFLIDMCDDYGILVGGE